MRFVRGDHNPKCRWVRNQTVVTHTLQNRGLRVPELSNQVKVLPELTKPRIIVFFFSFCICIMDLWHTLLPMCLMRKKDRAGVKKVQKYFCQIATNTYVDTQPTEQQSHTKYGIL